MFTISTRFAGQPAAAFKLGLACAVTLFLASTSARANTINLVQNGNFETNSGAGQVGYNTSITGWSMASAHSPGYTFLFASGKADNTGANGQYGNLSLWGPGKGSANGLPASSPAGGYFLALDSDFQMDAIQQTINGLTPGDYYTVGFWWAAAQQYTFNGSTYDTFQVSLGGTTHTTSELDIPSHGFSGWKYQTFTYKATSTSEVLSFLAVGGPNPYTKNSVPPFALLDGVSITPAPESPSAYLLLTGCVCLGAMAFFRRRQLAGNRTA